MGSRYCWAGGLLIVALAGCNRQDTDCLSRVGRKLLDRAHGATHDLRGKLDFGLSAAGVQERVQQRLRADKALAETAIEVTGQGAEVELKGTVKTRDQRMRAVDLAETTVGVEKLTDVLQVSEP
jgi:hypothetical protein